jgi:DeoR/GlpR family transcriptional regulator of sugar metabolism
MPVRELRLRQLREVVLGEGSVRVGDVGRRLGVSDETIRRDLDALAERGLIIRTRGGAVAPTDALLEQPYGIRQGEQRDEKRAIGRLVAEELVRPGMAIALDTGSTSLEVARAVRAIPLTIVTNSLPITTELLGSEASVLILGGVARAKSMSVTGPVAERAADEFHCDIAFVSAPAITPTLGPMDTDLEEVEVKRRFVGRASRVYAIVDHTKLGRTAFITICPAGDLDGLVTDSRADPEMLEQFREIGLDVRVAAV